MSKTRIGKGVFLTKGECRKIHHVQSLADHIGKTDIIVLSR
jgi:hypothetical protein